MDSTIFARLINQPEEAAAYVNDLEELARQNPWFHTAHLLLMMLKNAQGNALCVRDRALLFYYLHHRELFIKQTGSSPTPQPTPITAPPATQGVSTANSLIDRFLASNPTKITAKKTDFEADVNAGMVEDAALASEPLAEIHLSQGHLQKALSIYEQLILKFPEKHAYFAAKIKSIKNQNR